MKKIFWKLLLVVVFIIIVLNYNDIKLHFYKNLYKLDYEQYVEKYSEEYNVDKYLVFAIIKAESNFEPTAVSHKEAKGLMQLMYPTAEDVAKKVNVDLNEENVLTPEININLGTKYISMLMQKYENINLALAAYNGGSGNVTKWLNNPEYSSDGENLTYIPFKETKKYVDKVNTRYNIYKFLYE